MRLFGEGTGGRTIVGEVVQEGQAEREEVQYDVVKRV